MQVFSKAVNCPQPYRPRFDVKITYCGNFLQLLLLRSTTKKNFSKHRLILESRLKLFSHVQKSIDRIFILHIDIIISNNYSRFQITFHCNIPNFVAKFGSSLRSSKVHFRIHEPVCKQRL